MNCLSRETIQEYIDKELPLEKHTEVMSVTRPTFLNFRLMHMFVKSLKLFHQTQ